MSDRSPHKVLARELPAWVLLMLLAGCGFRLAGGPTVGQLEGLWVTPGPENSPLARALVERIELAGGTLAPNADAAQLAVQLGEADLRRRSISVTSRARTAEYQLIAAVTYSVARPDGASLLEPRRIEAQTVYRRDRKNLLGNAEAQQRLERELRGDLTERMLRAIGRALEAAGTPSRPGGR